MVPFVSALRLDPHQLRTRSRIGRCRCLVTSGWSGSSLAQVPSFFWGNLLPYLCMTCFLIPGGPSGINFDRYEDIPVEATGSTVPPPIEDVSTPNVKAFRTRGSLSIHFVFRILVPSG
jgi:hypothetical protein